MTHLPIRLTALLLLPLFLLILIFEARGASAGSLSPGDLALVGLNLDGSPKSFALVALVDLEGGTAIKITDRGWIAATSGFFNNSEVEGTITWTTPAQGVPAGTLIMFEINQSGLVALTPALGTASVTGFSATNPQFVPWSGGGEQLLIYTGSDDAPNFIYGLSNTWINGSPNTYVDWQPVGQPIASTGSNLPSALAANNGQTPPREVAFNGHAVNRGQPTHVDNIIYNGVRAGNRDELLTAIGDQANWLFDDLTPFDLAPGGNEFGPNPVFILSNPTGINLAAGPSAGPNAATWLPVLLLLAAAGSIAALALRGRD